MKHSTWPAIALLSLAVPATAGELNPDHVAAEARWLVHIDVQAAARSTFRSQLEQLIGDEIELDEIEELGAFPNIAGLKPWEDIRSLTFYSASPSPEDAVALVHTSPAVETALGDLRGMPGYRSIKATGGTLHAWEDDHEAWFAYVHYVGEDDRLVFFSDDEQRLLASLDVVLGKRPSLADSSDKAIHALPRKGSIVFVAMTMIEGMDGWVPHDASAVVQLVHGFSFDIGERGGNVEANLTIETREPEDATNVGQILQGIVALGSLVGNEAPGHEPLQRLVQSVSFQTAGNRVSLDFSYPTRDLVDLLHDLHH